MNEAYVLSLVAVLGLLGLLVIVFLLHRTQREMIRKNAADQVSMNSRVANLEEQFLGLPLTRKRMSEAVREGIDPLNKRLDSTDRSIAEVRDLLASVANKVGA